MEAGGAIALLVAVLFLFVIVWRLMDLSSHVENAEGTWETKKKEDLMSSIKDLEAKLANLRREWELADKDVVKAKSKLKAQYRKEVQAEIEEQLTVSFEQAKIKHNDANTLKREAKEEAARVLEEARVAAEYLVAEAKAEAERIISDGNETKAAAETYAKAIREFATNNPLGN